MAYLSTTNVLFELTPQGLDYTRPMKARWITCRLGMHIMLPAQDIPIPPKLMAMPHAEIGQLVGWTRRFVKRLTELPIGQPHTRQIEPLKFVFFPMQMDFKFACLEGDVTEDLEGIVSLRIMLNLGAFNPEYQTEFVGVETSADPGQLLTFMKLLEEEADRAVNSR